jgi:hypothetical protein
VSLRKDLVEFAKSQTLGGIAFMSSLIPSSPQHKIFLYHIITITRRDKEKGKIPDTCEQERGSFLLAGGLLKIRIARWMIEDS